MNLKKILSISLSASIILVLLFITTATTQALEEDPEIKIKNINKYAVDKNNVQIAFEVKNSSSFSTWDTKIIYKRKGQTGYPYEVTSGFKIEDDIIYTSLTDLVPHSRYYFKILYSDNGQDVWSDKKTFKTKKTKKMYIRYAGPTQLYGGDKMTIYGKNFGKYGGQVEIGYAYDNDAEIVSWSNNKIIVNIPEEATDGPITVKAHPKQGTRHTYYNLTTVSDFEIDVVDQIHEYNVACMAGVIADTYEEVINYDNLYLEYFGRQARCDELEFHLQHNTSHEDLITWMMEQEDYTWWSNLITTYEGEAIYGSVSKDVYYVKDGLLYSVPDLMTAYAWKIHPDEIIKNEDIDDDNYSTVWANANELKFWGGSIYKKVKKAATKGKDISLTKYPDLETYINDNKELLEVDHEGSETVCKYLECGQLY